MMEMDDANGFADRKPGMSSGRPASGRPSLRQDDGVGKSSAGAKPLAEPPAGQSAAWARIERAWWLALGGAILVFSAFPIANLVLGYPTKDYGLWYQVGLAVRQGFDVYPRPESGRLFPFMYPPSAAAMLAWTSMLGRSGSLLALVLVNSAAWLASIAFSVYLVVKPGGRRHPLVVILPSLSIVVLVHNIYLLGQPNLLLLALLLGAFACLQHARPVWAGVLVATAAAIKAFPIMALGYLIYRRMWAASAATVVTLAAWLLIAPLPFRSPAQTVDDVVVWSKGMLFTYNSYGIAQRPFRSYSYKNQSIMALLHRLLRDVPADGEAVLSRHAKERQARPRPTKGIAAVDPATDLLSYLKPHAQGSRDPANVTTASRAELGPVVLGAASTGDRDPASSTRWNDALLGRIRAPQCLEGQLPQLEFSQRDGRHPGGDRGPVRLRPGCAAAAQSSYPGDRRPGICHRRPVDRDVFSTLVQLCLCLVNLSDDTWFTSGHERAARCFRPPLQGRLDRSGVPGTRVGVADALSGPSLRQPVPARTAPPPRPGGDAPCGRPLQPRSIHRTFGQPYTQ